MIQDIFKLFVGMKENYVHIITCNINGTLEREVTDCMQLPDKYVLRNIFIERIVSIILNIY